MAQDYAAAAKWFRAAAERGLMRAQYDLGVLYERGRGVPLDYQQAAAWYRKAAEQSHPLAQYNLAVAYTKGQGVRQNFFEAAVWYHRAAAQGVIAAMVNLAILYERGDGVDALDGRRLCLVPRRRAARQPAGGAPRRRAIAGVLAVGADARRGQDRRTSTPRSATRSARARGSPAASRRPRPRPMAGRC